ncbi:MAG: glycosyltransferase family 4 protein [Chitinophagales bacterium]|nr:glycosyltransferase family 4 protein [Chitinophagales bacterium]
MKLAIVTTHPIQYNAPWFRLLAQQDGISVKVFYTWEQSATSAKYDPGFGKVIEWDLPLLDGYEYTFVKNVSAEPGSHHYKGIINPSLNQEIEDWGADAVLVFGWPFNSHLKCMKYFHGKIPVLFRGDSTLLIEAGGIKKILRRLWLKYIYSFVDYALYVGANNKTYFRAHGMKERELIFVPHAIDNERFSGNAAANELKAKQWRQDLGIADDELTVVYAGKFDTVKNPSFLLEVAKVCKTPGVRFILIGNGPLEADMKQSAIDDRVIFLDFQNQQKMPVVYRLADVFVMSSVSETWGLGINEALVCGCKIVTNNKVGCATDLVKDEDTGIVIERGDVHAAAGYINEQIKLKAQGRFVKNIKESLLQTYSFATIVANISSLLKQLEQGKK